MERSIKNPQTKNKIAEIAANPKASKTLWTFSDFKNTRNIRQHTEIVVKTDAKKASKTGISSACSGKSQRKIIFQFPPNHQN